MRDSAVFPTIHRLIAHRERRFVGFRVDSAGGTLPIDPPTGRPANCTDPATWGTFTQARRCAPHVGVALAGDFAVLDFDKVIEDGRVDERVRRDLAAIGCPVEVSVSGRGLHAFVDGPLDDACACPRTRTARLRVLPAVPVHPADRHPLAAGG